MNSQNTQLKETHKAHESFEFLGSTTIDSLNIEVQSYEHKKTGARHFHLAADNDENVFLVGLKTVPVDSTGVAHILEHTVLCGSEKYPVRDPFFMMLRRSINTFMNALTSSDWTAFPFATQNRKDFNNLLGVYLDAVFFPRIAELDFKQEGHRLEFEEKQNPESELTFKGVVFNEMKGAMSAESSVLYQTISKHLFPTNTYHFNSGGEPENIPDLSYKGLREFYRKHYHPSNAIFFTFGNIPASENQAQFEEQVLSRFERSNDLPVVALEQRYQSEVIVEESYAVEGEQKNKTHVTLSWLLGESSDLMNSLRAHLLSSVLLDNSASPLRYVLESSELGLAPSPMCGLEDSNREMIFACGLEGSEADNAEAIEKEILDCLESVKKNGVDQKQVEAVLHQLELSQREVGGDRYPYGLQLILTALSPVIHGASVTEVLDLDPAVEILRKEIADPKFIPNLIDELLLKNKHRVRLTLKPDGKLAEKKVLQEKARLAKIKSELSEQEKAVIIEQSVALETRQNTEEDESILPKVGKEDVPKENQYPEDNFHDIDGLKLTSFEQGTNGLLYQQVIADLPDLNEQEQQLLPLYSKCFGELGAGELSYQQIQMTLDEHTGGIHASFTYKYLPSIETLQGHFVLSGKALNRKTVDLNNLLESIFKSTRFDELDRLKEIVAQARLSKEQSVTSNGHSLAMLAASSGLSPTSLISHALGGLNSIQTFRELDDALQSSDSAAQLKSLSERLQSLHEKMLVMPRQFLLVSEAKELEQVQKSLKLHWKTNQQGENKNALSLPSSWSGVRQVQEMWLCNTQVNFCAKAYPAVDVEHEDAPALTILGGFLRNGCLHKLIREQGGAYGGGASFDASSRSFRFFSYRDPRLADTLTDFDKSIEWMLNEKHSEQKLEEAILGVVSDIDKPGSPAGQAKSTFHANLYGRTPEKRKAFRKNILSVSLDDLKNVTEKYLKNGTASVAVVCPQDKKELAKDLGLQVVSLV
jgi:Zn-dependent M16 (insulinase) family peptidase